MEYRIGKCSQCGAEYKVPASFAHNVARCKLCKGVVHLTPAKGASPALAASEAPRAAPPPPPAPLAPPPPAEPAAAPAAKPERRPAPDVVPKRGPRPEAAAARAERPPAPAAERERAPLSASPASAAGGKKSRVGLLVGLALVLLALVLFLLRDQLFGAERNAGAPAGSNAGSSQPQGNADRSPLEPAHRESLAPPLASAGAGPGATGADPGAIDLRGWPDLEPTGDTSTQEWKQLEEWVSQWLDEDAGAAGDQAARELAHRGRPAVPAILNFLRRQDYATPEGRRVGDLAMPLLKGLSNGKDFGWPPAKGSSDVPACQRAVREWILAWRRCEQDIEVWIELARLDELAPEEATRLRATFGVGPEETEPEEGD